jgi:ABC-type transport system substrate-binding protein
MFKIFFILILALSCTSENDSSKKVLNLAISSDASTLDTALAYDTISSQVVGQVNETLYEYHYLNRPFTLKPLLAESMPDISNDGLTYKIKIKKNVKYHPSTVLDKSRTLIAQDFINQIKRIAFKPTQSSGWWLFDDKIIGLNSFRSNAKKDLSNFFDLSVKGLSAPDKHTLVIKLKRPYPQLVYALAMAFTSPTPNEVIKASNNNLNRGVVGTGPFRIIEWNNGLNIILEKFDAYHDQKYPTSGDQYSHKNNLLADAQKSLPLIDKVEFKIIKESQTRWLNFLNKKIDLIVLSKEHFSLALDAAGKVKKEIKDKGIKLQIASTLTYWWLAFNMNDKILGKNKKIREAIAHAVNIDSYIDIFTNKIALKANSIFPPGIVGYDPSNELPYSHDITKAKKLLAEAGYPNGKGLPVINYDVRGNSTVSRQMGEFIQKELSKIGIRIKVIMNPFSQFLRKARTGQLQFWQGGWALDYPDAENVVQLLYSKNHPPGPNSTFYTNPRIDKIYKELSQTSNLNRVNGLTKKAQKIINEDLPWIMQFYSRNYILIHDRVENYRQSDLIYNSLKYINVKE